MNPKLKEFQTKYPNLFREEGPRSGFYVGEGWYQLVDNLSALINSHVQHSVPEELRGEIYVAQVKEKFGSLRYYMNAETPYISGAIAMAEAISSVTCEQCGKPGKQRSGGWIKTLCDICAEIKTK